MLVDRHRSEDRLSRVVDLVRGRKSDSFPKRAHGLVIRVEGEYLARGPTCLAIAAVASLEVFTDEHVICTTSAPSALRLRARY